MKLTVIIVNYNVETYLKQCLSSVMKALDKITGEVFVVDNQSTDGSVAMVRQQFPEVKVIANTENIGFSRANNQAIKVAQGEYVVLLNPDTVVGEDIFQTVCQFMDQHPDSGGLGVKMIDGAGHFLPESKRGLPTPAVAFYKIIGLTRLFPRSKVFGRYQLGHLADNEIAEIEILSGACMFLRKKTLDKVGLLDESFFMYGEDIDLSYRIMLGGWKNYYYPKAQIIHYKGESTKKSSINYVIVFYNAMAIFAKKHFSSKGADLIGSLISAAIFISAILAIIVRFLQRMTLLILDLSIFTVLLTLSPYVGSQTQLIVLSLVTFAISALSGAYDVPAQIKKSLKGPVITSLAVAAMNLVFNLFAWQVLTSTFVIITTSMILARLAMHLAGFKGFELRANRKRKVLTVGSKAEADRSTALLWQTHYGLSDIIHYETDGKGLSDDTLRKLIRKTKVDEVVFCAKDLSSQQIISLMHKMRDGRAQFKIVSPGASYIIGSNSIESIKDLFLLRGFGIISAASVRSKRILDILLSTILLISLPVSYWIIKERKNLFTNISNVLRGTKSWVGYSKDRPIKRIRFRKPGILKPITSKFADVSAQAKERAELVYAKDYHYMIDIRSFLSGFKFLGR